MSAPQNFRSAFHGFNREDVASYLEYLNRKHQNQINQLTAQLEEAQGQIDPELPRDREGLERYVNEATAQLSAQLEAAQAACAELSAQLEEANQARTQLTERLEALEGEETSRESGPDRELEAYRRAERIQRSAKEQSQLVYYQVNGVLTEAVEKVEGAAAELTEMADLAAGQLTKLQVAVSASKQTLQDAASLMRAIRPNN